MGAGLVVQDTTTGPQAATLGAGQKLVAPSGAVTMDADGVFTLADGGVSLSKLAAALAAKLWTVVVTAGAEAANKRILSVQVTDIQGNNVAAATQLVLKPTTAVNASYAVSDDGAGTGLTTSGDKVSAIVTDATGLAEIGITDTAGETIAVAFDTPLGPVVTSLVFAP